MPTDSRQALVCSHIVRSKLTRTRNSAVLRMAAVIFGTLLVLTPPVGAATPALAESNATLTWSQFPGSGPPALKQRNDGKSTTPRLAKRSSSAAC